MKSQVFASRRQQAGISLIMVLVLLLIMTLLGLAVLRSTLLEERMSANLLDRSLSFQAAEAALREGEAVVLARGLAGTAVPEAGDGCDAGVCEAPAATSTQRWQDTAFAGWRTATADVSSLTSAPAFYVEYMGSSEAWLGCNDLGSKYAGSAICVRPVYRITARSQAAGRASVILQSNFIAP